MKQNKEYVLEFDYEGRDLAEVSGIPVAVLEGYDEFMNDMVLPEIRECKVKNINRALELMYRKTVDDERFAVWLAVKTLHRLRDEMVEAAAKDLLGDVARNILEAREG